MKKRVKIPVGSPKQILDLAKRIQEKHNLSGAQSPLRMLDHVDINAEIESAWQAYEKTELLRRQTLAASKQSAMKLRPVLNLIRDCRDALSARYSGEQMKELGHWGFDVAERKVTRRRPVKTTGIDSEV